MRFSLPFSYGMWTTPEGVNLAKRRGEEEGEKELLRNFRTEQESLAQDYANSLKALGQARQEPIPLRQPTQTEAGLTMLADLLRNITSTVPESQRQQQPSGLQMLRGLREDERTRLQDAERMRAENQRNALLADAQAQELRYNAGAAKLTAAQRATEFAGGRTDIASGRLQEQTQFLTTEGRLNAEAKLRAVQWDKEFGLRERAQNWAEMPEFTKAGREYDAAVKGGMPEKEAYITLYATFILNRIAVEKADAGLKRELELYRLLPVADEAKHIVWQRLAEREAHRKSMAEMDAQIASHNRANRGEPLPPQWVADYKKDAQTEMDGNVELYKSLIRKRDEIRANPVYDDGKPIKNLDKMLSSMNESLRDYKRGWRKARDKRDALGAGTYAPPVDEAAAEEEMRQAFGG